MEELVAIIEDPGDVRLPPLAREALGSLVEQLRSAQARIKQLEATLMAWHRSNEASRRLATIPGVGVITATALVATIGDGAQFRSGRQLSAWLGLVPRQHSSGGKDRLGRISKRGDGYIRRLLVHGARSVLRWRRAKPGTLRIRANISLLGVGVHSEKFAVLTIMDNDFAVPDAITDLSASYAAAKAVWPLCETPRATSMAPVGVSRTKIPPYPPATASRGVPAPMSWRISNDRLWPATWSRYRLCTFSRPRSQVRRMPPRSRLWAKQRSTISARSLKASRATPDLSRARLLVTARRAASSPCQREKPVCLGAAIRVFQGLSFRALCETPAMANMTVKTLTHMYALARDWGIAPEDSHPCRSIPMNPKHSRERFLTDAEFTRLGQVLDEVSGKGSRVSTGAVATIPLLMLTGCRRSEILTLR